MKRSGFLAILAMVVAWAAPALPDEKPEFLAAFDPARDAIQLEFENQVDPACFWRPYQLRDAIAAELEALGIGIAGSSLYVLDVMSWGLETDEEHGVAAVPDAVREVVQDPPAGRHPGRRDDHERSEPFVEGLGLVGGPGLDDVERREQLTVEQLGPELG